MKQSRKVRRNLALAACAVFLPAMIGCGNEVVEAGPIVRPVKTITLGENSGTSTRVFPGTLQASERAQLSFRVAGPLVELPAKEGLQVRQGQLLARIDPRDFETAVRNLEAQLATLKAQRKAMDQARPEDIVRAEANLAAAQARLLQARANFRRYQRLYENDNVSLAEFDRSRAARDVADANVQTSVEALKIARSGARVEDVEAMNARIRSFEARLQRARDDLKDTSLVAPYDGVVAQLFVENFEFIQAREPIVSLQNIEIMELVVQIPETIVAKYKRGEAVAPPVLQATFPSLPGVELPAKLTEYSSQADPVTRTYKVTLQVRQPRNGTILAGMTGEVHVPPDEAGTVGFSVPSAAVFTDEAGESCVWKVDVNDGSITRQKVKLGQMAGESVMLLSGVKRGDTVVTAGASYLDKGMKVRQITTELRERR